MRSCGIQVEFCRISGIFTLENHFLIATAHIQGFLEFKGVVLSVNGNDAFSAHVDYAHFPAVKEVGSLQRVDGFQYQGPGCRNGAAEDEAVIQRVSEVDFIGHHYLGHHETGSEGLGVVMLDIVGMAGGLDGILGLCAAFSDTVRQSVSIMRYLEENGFPVPKTILTKSREAIFESEADGEKSLIVLMEFIDGEEPELETCAAEVGDLVGEFHKLMDNYPAELVVHGKEFFIDRYLEFLRKKNYPCVAEYEELGERLWDKVKDLPQGKCHGDLHRGNLLQSTDGKIYLVDFDTAAQAPLMFDIMVMCDMTNYFNLQQEDIKLTKEVYQKFLSGYLSHHTLSREEILTFPYWVAIRHFQLQATILEIHGADCIDEGFIDGQLYWLNKWMLQVS